MDTQKLEVDSGTGGDLKSNSCASNNSRDYYTGNDTKYANASHYSYDIHGNVEELVQEDSTLRSLDDVANARYQSYKTFEYSYDLVSGNVNMLAYQHGQADAFYYKYEYDADNRVTAAYSHAGPLVARPTAASTGSAGSAYGVIASGAELWDRDAKYFYYQHGPLARTEIGHNKVQASDYAYTLHGWIKGVNSNALTSTKDMGNDANNDASIAPITNHYVGKDQYGYQLTYYDTSGHRDYTSITTNAAFASQDGSSLASSSANLWNGNIKNMVTSIAPFMVTGRPQARAFTYDQLNRIKVAQVDTAYTVATNVWTTGGNLNSWKESFIYDNNGNIQTLVRHGKSSVATAMDSMTYNYVSGKNQLEYVDDAVSSGNYTTDIDDQSALNYSYDKIGNLVGDVSEEIDSIVWNVYGKIERVVRDAASTKSDLEFRYDAMGNRVCKIVKPRDGTGLIDQDGWSYTYYLRDASGNVIAVYDRDYSTPGATYTDELSLKEDHLYGSSRTGIRTVDEVLSTTTYTYSSTNANGTFVGTFSSRTATATSTTNFNHELKRKAYELSNHLGNVLVTVSDARTANNSSGTVTSFSAVVLNAQDYYAFGSSMVGRNIMLSHYRYGFNGAEQVDEIDGSGDYLSFEYRIEDSRLGRFLSQDPMSADFPWNSPYAFAENMPLIGPDLEGLEQPNNPNQTQDPADTGQSGTISGDNIDQKIQWTIATTHNWTNLGGELVSRSGTVKPSPRFDEWIGAYRPPEGNTGYNYSSTTTSVTTYHAGVDVVDEYAFGFEPYIDKVYETSESVNGVYSEDGKTFTETITTTLSIAEVSSEGHVSNVRQITSTEVKTYNVIGADGEVRTYNGRQVSGQILELKSVTSAAPVVRTGSSTAISYAFYDRICRAAIYNTNTLSNNASAVGQKMGEVITGVGQDLTDQLVPLPK